MSLRSLFIPSAPQFPWRRALIAAHGATAVVIDGAPRETIAHTITLDGGKVPEWVHLIPAGTFTGRDGRGPYTLGNVRDVIAKTTAHFNNQPLPIDFGHALESDEHAPDRGNGAPAAAWIVALEERPTGLWGKVEWTPDGGAAIRDKRYRFLSPVFAYNQKSGEILALLRAGLTNKPNLGLTAINSTTLQGETRMNEALKAALQRLAVAIGLSATSEPDAVVAAAQSAVEAGTQHKSVLSSLRTKLRLTETSTVDEIVTAAQAATTIDPSKYVPMAQHSAVVDELRKVRTKETEAVVDAAIKAGKLIPAQREWAIDYHARQPESFATFVEKQPVIVKAGAEAHVVAGAGDGKLTDEERSICATLNIDEKKFLETKAKETQS